MKTTRLLAVVLAAACGEGGGTEPPPAPTLAVSLAGAVGLVQGQSNSTVVTVTRGGGYAGTVGFAVGGLPSGVTGKFDPASLPGGSGAGTSVLTLSASPGAVLGSATYNVTVNGTGVADATATATLTVSEAPGFSMEVAPTSVSIEQGKNGTAVVSFTRRGGFSGPIALSVAGLPTGVTAEFDNAAPTGNSAVLTLTVGAGVATGSYLLQITGQGDPGTRTANLGLTVTASQPAPSFGLAVAPSAVSVQAGSTGQATVTIARSGGFTGAVNLSVAGHPAGVTPAFDNSAPTGTTVVLTLSALSSAAPGTYLLLVRGAAPGLADQTANLSLTVTPSVGGFALSASPTNVTIQVGQSGQSTITVTKSGTFSGSVTLTAIGLPAGVTASFNPPTPSPARAAPQFVDVQVVSQMTVTVGAAVPSANYAFQVRGTAAGQPNQTIGLTLTVNPPPGTGNTTFTFCGPAPLPIWFAYQNGAGSWTRVVGATTATRATYSFDITAGTGAAAFVTGDEFSGYSGSVFQGTQAELQQFGAAQCRALVAGSKTLTGSVAGVPTADRVEVNVGDASDFATGSSPAFILKQVPTEAADLLAVQSRQELVGSGFRSLPVKLITRRGVNYPNGSVIPTLNFTSEGFAPATAALTLANLGSDSPSLVMDYRTATTSASIFYSIEAGGAAQTVYGFPPGQQSVADLHILTLFAAPSGSENGRTWTGWFKTLGDRTVSLAEVLSAPTVTSIFPAPYPRLQATGAIQASYDDVFSFSMTQGLPDGTGRAWSAQASRAAFGGSTYLLVIPDLSAVAGWSTTWALQSGSTVEWMVTASGITGNVVLPPGTEGSVEQSARRSGFITP